MVKNASIEQVELYGDYIIVSEGVALVHAGKEYGVNKDGLSLLVSGEGIVFFDPGKKVHLLFCLASTGEQDNLKLLQQIVRLGQIEGLVQEICRQKTPGDVRHQLAITETE
ncbi:MAG: PTS sugar transporter subunit IIA [Eubacterium sp.]|nr:PTS sugar transporter subunit IIA [Eubacterium sp.]